MKKIRCIIVIALMLPTGIFGCLVCCATSPVDTCCRENYSGEPGSGIVVIQEQPSYKVNSCCEQSEGDEDTDCVRPFSERVGVTRCCLIGGHTLGAAALPQRFDDSTAALKSNSLPVTSDISPGVGLLVYGPLPNGESTYLRCCVLLI